jgi:hypothetical protein
MKLRGIPAANVIPKIAATANKTTAMAFNAILIKSPYQLSLYK